MRAASWRNRFLAAAGFLHTGHFGNGVQGFLQLGRGADFGGKGHARKALGTLRVDADDVDFLSRKDFGDVAQQTLAVAGQNKDVDRVHGIVAARAAPLREDHALGRLGAHFLEILAGGAVYRHALAAQDRLVIPVPLYHCFGMVMGNLGCITHGTTMIYPNDGFDPLLTLSAVAEERATGLYGVPTMFIAVLDHPRRGEFDLATLRTGIMAGATCPIEVMRRVISELHMGEVQIAYGMTETSPVSLQTGANDDLERRVTTVGRTQPQLESKIIDTDGNTVARGEIGELCTRGYSVMLGYWNNPDATREAIDDAGWMHTGDLASMDEHGYVSIAGRNKDMIIRGGENVYPRELEEFFFTHPAVADVQIIGIPDARYGEEIVAWVKFHPGHVANALELQTWCKGRIAHFKTPRHFKFVDEFPMTVTGKIQKFRMREISIEELNIRR